MSQIEWQKILWKQQPFPDNYVPDSFLSSLRKNANFRPYTYSTLVLSACAVTQHLSTIFIFLAVFARLYEGWLDPRQLVWVSIGGYAFGYSLWELAVSGFYNANQRRENRQKAVKSSILVFLALIALSPVLRTLTAATSSDSIWALSAFLFILNAVLADYGSSRPLRQAYEKLSSVLSMNAAISASVVLASRLSSNLAVFALILFSVQLFALYPFLRMVLERCPAVVWISTTAGLVCLSVCLNASLSTTATYIFATTLVLVTFWAPAILIWAQRHKNEIKGSWDVAVPKVRL